MTAIHAPAPAATASPAPAATRSLLACAAVSGPLWAAVSLAQAATREGFDLTRHPLSALSNGPLGWLQIANFVLAGVLMIAGAAGLRRALHGTPGGAWAPRLVRVTGIGMIAAGVFVMDPGDGFPAGTPAGPGTLSWHGLGHMAAGSISFLALIIACHLLGHHFRRTGRRGHALASHLAGTALLLGDVWAMSGGTAGSLTLAAGAITAMLWVSWVSARCLRAL
ncbi:hypothetical protein HNP84_003466 [Thermocatellispora tengchongensis]|uniref:DUF998 domain-containing protein n=1 Tax=Thermocatellispora tengchongensis TaxID=1073253 RepID=A0A840P8H4_9ACTN|nr:DUF998 domain-containing protein [Thermocatellispora tengchongensis]MBB5133740.1 hypothetical protein [Thermocatellispora tengchongensis]